MTLKNNRAPLPYYVKLCASFQIHWGSKTWVTAWKNSSLVKINIFFLSRMTLKIDVWPWKTIGHLSYAASTVVHLFIANGEFHLELQSGNAQFGSKSTIFFSHVTLKFDGWPWRTIRFGNGLMGPWPLWPWPLTLTFCMDIVSVNGTNSWKFQDDTMTGTLSKRCDRWTDGQTDRQTDGNKCS